MIQSQNSSVEYTCKASSLNGLTSNGSIMVGNNALEYYNEKNVEDYIQIPWNEVDYISASVYGKRHIARWAVFTKENGHYTFSTEDNRVTLRAIRNHVDPERMYRSKTFFQVLGAGFVELGRRISGLFHPARKSGEQE